MWLHVEIAAGPLLCICAPRVSNSDGPIQSPRATAVLAILYVMLCCQITHRSAVLFFFLGKEIDTRTIELKQKVHFHV